MDRVKRGKGMAGKMNTEGDTVKEKEGSLRTSIEHPFMI